MACVQGFCVPAETPEFAAVCAEGDGSSNSTAQAATAVSSSAQIDKGSAGIGAPTEIGSGGRSPVQSPSS